MSTITYLPHVKSYYCDLCNDVVPEHGHCDSCEEIRADNERDERNVCTTCLGTEDFTQNTALGQALIMKWGQDYKEHGEDYANSQWAAAFEQIRTMR